MSSKSGKSKSKRKGKETKYETETKDLPAEKKKKGRTNVSPDVEIQETKEEMKKVMEVASSIGTDKMGKTVKKLYKQLVNKINKVCDHHGVPHEERVKLLSLTYQNVVGSEAQTTTIKQMMKNINVNTNPRSLQELVFHIRGKFPTSSDITTTTGTQRLSARQVESDMQRIFNKISQFGAELNKSSLEISDANKFIYELVLHARKNKMKSQHKATETILNNIAKNEGTAQTLSKLLLDADIPILELDIPREPRSKYTAEDAPKILKPPQTSDALPEDIEEITSSLNVSTLSNRSSSINASTLSKSSSGQETFTPSYEPSFTESIGDIGVEPELTDAQKKHITDIIQMIEKDPKLKADIKRTITEELTKGYINKSQYKMYNEELEKLNIIQDTPKAIRGKRTKRKNKQSDKSIIPLNLEPSPLPKDKPYKTTSKKKDKIVTL